MKQPYNTALYMRLSRDDETYGDSVSIETQRMILQKYAEENAGYAAEGEHGKHFLHLASEPRKFNKTDAPQHHEKSVSHVRKHETEDHGIEYRHYKGGTYKVIGIGKHSENLEVLVVYQALYENYDIWCRPLSMWNDIVEYNGKKVKRFELIEENDG